MHRHKKLCAWDGRHIILPCNLHCLFADRLGIARLLRCSSAILRIAVCHLWDDEFADARFRLAVGIPPIPAVTTPPRKITLCRSHNRVESRTAATFVEAIR